MPPQVPTATPAVEAVAPAPAEAARAAEDRAREDAGLVLDDLLVEDVSIDGMCGVY